jgi:hypothetical protein
MALYYQKEHAILRNLNISAITFFIVAQKI